MTPQEIARKVLDEVLTSKDRWTQGMSAVDANGMMVTPTSTAAVKWCLMGAVDKIVNNNYDDYVNCKLALCEAVVRLGGSCYGVTIYNDTHTFADVCRVLEVVANGNDNEKIKAE